MNELTRCLCCDNEVVQLIDFGLMQLVNTYSVLDKYPLSVNRCISCCHLQLNEFVSPEILYRDYTYQSGTGRTASEYFASFAKTALSYFPTARNVMDIASNEGSQLDAFQALGLGTYGIDPAGNLSRIASDKGHNIQVNFFENVEFDYGTVFDLITAQNVIAHTSNPLGFLQNCRRIMHDQSRLFIATSQANMIVNGEAGACYHEHVSYFNLHSMIKLSERANLVVLDLIMPDIHGTSYVFVLGKSGMQSRQVDDRLEWEFLVGMMGPRLHQWWKNHVETKLERINQTIINYVKRGFYTVGVGAAAKGISLLNMADVQLDILADNTPTKWNKISSGMAIVPFDEIDKITREKVLFVILAWNLRSELKENTLRLRNNSQDIFIEIK